MSARTYSDLPGSNEGFTLDGQGVKQDASLHAEMLANQAAEDASARLQIAAALERGEPLTEVLAAYATDAVRAEYI